MKILFDHQIFLLRKYGGIFRYFTKTVNELVSMGDNVRILAPIYRNQYLDRHARPDITGMERF